MIFKILRKPSIQKNNFQGDEGRNPTRPGAAGPGQGDWEDQQNLKEPF